MIERVINQHRAINIFFVLVFVLGFLSLTKLGREELPEFGGEGLNVLAVLPGASPDEMDLTVARLLNSEIIGLPGVDEVVSKAGEGFVSLSISVMEDETDLDGLRREITQRVSQVPELPVDLEGPFISRQFDRLFPPITLLFKGGNELERHNAWLMAERQLQSLDEVDAIETLGDRDRRLEVRVNTHKLQLSGSRLDKLSEQIRVSITDAGAGVVHSRLATARIRTQQQPVDAPGLGQIMLPTRSGVMPVSYFGEVTESLAPPSIRVKHEGTESWYVNLYRRQGSNVSALSEKVLVIVNRLNKEYEKENLPFRITILHDRSHVVTESLVQLTTSIILGMAIVFLILWLFLGSRNAFYAAIGIPFSFFAAFIAMDLLGLSINILTLFGLVLVCGMVVDDAIVVLENVDRKQKAGASSLNAIEDGIKEVAPAVMAATGTTIAVFMPLMMMSGGMGMYISQIPKVAILALVASLAECFIILPVHLYSKRQSTSGGTALNSIAISSPNVIQETLRRGMDRLSDRFSTLSSLLVGRPYLSFLGFVAFMFVTGGVSYLKMDFDLFTATETRVIKFHIELEEIVDLETNSRLMNHAANQLNQLDEYFSDTVVIAGHMNVNYDNIEKENVATIELLLSSEAIKQDISTEIADRAEAIIDALPGIKRIRRSLETNAPPTGVPVQIYLYGEEDTTLKLTAQRVREALGSIPSIRHISDPMEDGIHEQVFNLDSRLLSHHGLSSDLVAQLLRTSLTGYKVGKVDRGDEVIDVYVTSDGLSLEVIAKDDGSVIPLRDLGKFVEQSSPDTIRRLQGMRYISVTAEVDESKLSVFKTHREIERRIDESILLPGITFEQQGEYSDTQESLASMLQAALIGLGLSYFILTSLFRSLLQPIVVLLAIPLAYMGVVWGMTLTGQTLDMMGFVGVVGLMGIVINDSLVWVSFYNRARSNGIVARDAAVQAVGERFRPIWLTTITTVGGLLPVSFSESAGIANAMANTMVYGLVSASVLLLLFLPVCVVILDDINNRIRWRRGAVQLFAKDRVIAEN